MFRLLQDSVSVGVKSLALFLLCFDIVWESFIIDRDLAKYQEHFEISGNLQGYNGRTMEPLELDQKTFRVVESSMLQEMMKWEEFGKQKWNTGNECTAKWRCKIYLAPDGTGSRCSAIENWNDSKENSNRILSFWWHMVHEFCGS